MIFQVYSIYDIKAAAYHVPFFQPTKGMAIRLFGDAIIDPNSNLSKHPEDYRLFSLGEFDDFTGVLERRRTNEVLITGLEILVLKEAQTGNSEDQSPQLYEEK